MSEGGRVRVVVAEDHTLVREGLVAMLETYDDLEVVGEAADGAEALEVCATARPDVLLLDLRMPKVDGLEVLRRLRADAATSTRVLVLTVHDEQQYVTEALRAGADGYLLKTSAHADVAEAVRRVAGGDAVLHPAVARTVLTELSATGETGDLTPREMDVLRLLAKGLPNRRIGLETGMGIETVKTHVSHILAKLGAGDRTEAVAKALRRGLID